MKLTHQKPISELSPDNLAVWLSEHNQPKFRAKQIHEWIFKHNVADFSQMKNLPKTLLAELKHDFLPSALRVAERLQAEDGTVKWLFTLADNETIETVLIRAPERTTVCISTQVGCPVRCAFCASGRGGLVRDLSPGEILDQVREASREAETTGDRVNNIVVMGMGEPLLNLANLTTALELICSPDGLGIGKRHVTISTSGIVPGIRALAALGQPWNLALSLHATTDEERSKIIPNDYRYDLDDIFAACQEYRERTKRMITLEYALLAGRNDSTAQIGRLVKISRKLGAKINLIPCNSVTQTHQAPEESQIRWFAKTLEERGVTVTIRRRKGAEIEAACGQLRQRNKKA